MQILFCDSPGIVQAIYLIKVFLNIIRIVVPIGLIFMVTLDIYKNMLQGHEDKQNVITKIGNRLLAAAIVFFVPTFIHVFLRFINAIGVSSDDYRVNFLTCYTEASLDLVEALKENQQLELSAQEQYERIQIEMNVANYNAKRTADIEESQKRALASKNQNSTYTSNYTNLTRQNQVYIIDGTFYIPAYVKGNENTYSGKNCPTNPLQEGYKNPYGFNDTFYEMLENLINGAKNAGYNLSFLTERGGMGCRTYADQERIAIKYENQKGRAASPGKSKHGFGIAADLVFYKNANTKCGNSRSRTNCPGMAWVHDHAKDYGLHFPLNNDKARYREDWHIEPINLKTY